MNAGRLMAGPALVLALMIHPAGTVMAESDTGAPPAPFGQSADSGDPVLGALRQRRLVLDAREAELALRALELKAVERRIETRIRVLGKLADELKTVLASQAAVEQSRLRGLARSYEAMRPAEAAGLLDQLEPELRVAIARHMRQAKLGPVLARMTPENARQTTIGIAGNKTGPGKGS